MHVIIDVVHIEICQYILAQCLELSAKVGDSK
jgi:hypothetical protein